MKLLTLATLSLIAACTHHGSTTPGGGGGGGSGSGVVAKTTVDALPDGPPLVSPGEHMTYKLVLQGLEIASYELAIGAQAIDLDGKQAITVASRAKAQGLATLAVKVDDVFTSYIDVKTGRSLKWTTDEFAKNGKDKERTDADLAHRAGDTVPIQFHLNDEAPTPEPQKVGAGDVWDYNAFLVALRAWEGGIGSKITVEVLRSRFLWHVEMKIAAKEKLVTDMGEFPALRFDATSYKLGRDGQRFPDTDDRAFSIWISDDAGRVPLQVVAKTDYGDLKMSITDYQPGNGTPLRQ